MGHFVQEINHKHINTSIKGMCCWNMCTARDGTRHSSVDLEPKLYALLLNY